MLLGGSIMSKYLKKPWIILSVMVAVFSIAYVCCGRQPTKKTITFSELIDPLVVRSTRMPHLGFQASDERNDIDRGRRLWCQAWKGLLPSCNTYIGEEFYV